MLYVAGEILVWMVLAFILGIVIGWLLWGYRSRTETQRAERELQRRLTAAQQETEQSQPRTSRSSSPCGAATPRP